MMKPLLFSFVLILLTTACSDRSKHVVYDMLHEKNRQDCLKEGRSDCPPREGYGDYKKQRDEVVK